MNARLVVRPDGEARSPRYAPTADDLRRLAISLPDPSPAAGSSNKYRSMLVHAPIIHFCLACSLPCIMVNTCPLDLNFTNLPSSPPSSQLSSPASPTMSMSPYDTSPSPTYGSQELPARPFDATHPDAQPGPPLFSSAYASSEDMQDQPCDLRSSPASASEGQTYLPHLRTTIPHPYARLYAKKDGAKRRRIWNHALEKSLFSAHELYVFLIPVSVSPVPDRPEIVRPWAPPTDARFTLQA